MAKRILDKTNTTSIKLIISYLLLLLFLYAAVSKLLDFETFTVQLAQSPLLSAYAGIIAWLVPGIEIVIAMLLMVPRLRTIALYAAFTLMVMFTAYIYIILNFSDFIPCSCGGVLEKMSWTQHLFFNLAFIVLAALTLFLVQANKKKKTLVLLLALMLIGAGIVSLLFAFSEKKMSRNNAFQRRFVPHPIEKMNAIDLGYNSYYIAGLTDSIVYLGNVTAPLTILKLDTNLNILDSLKIELDNMELAYSKIQVDIVPPHFFVSDGNVPIALKGNINRWFAKTIMKDKVFFSQFIPLDTTQFVVRSIDGTSHNNIIASYSNRDSILSKNKNLLQAQTDGVFDTDGQLLYNSVHQQFIYIYFYRNEYFVFDRKLELIKRLKTIDTVTKANIALQQIATTQQKKLNPNALVINKRATTYGNYLFVESDRLGKYEDDKSLERAAIIDVYNFELETYAFSFYIYNYKKYKLSSFRVKNALLYAMLGDHLLVYNLNPKYFDNKEN
jgi:uncharacterized membrane protein YphA (DoxX/SURF4 family)